MSGLQVRCVFISLTFMPLGCVSLRILCWNPIRLIQMKTGNAGLMEQLVSILRLRKGGYFLMPVRQSDQICRSRSTTLTLP